MISCSRASSDVLVIGGGLTAAFAAIKAREAGASVTLVDKAFFGRGGCSAVASGIMRAFFQGDDLEKWVANSGGGATTRPFANSDLLRRVTLLSEEIVREMQRWGVRWIQDRGVIERVGSTDVGGPANLMMDGGGPQMMTAVRAEVLRRGVQVVNRVHINDLLTADGMAPTSSPVVGAIGIHTRTGEPHVFEARAVVMATGPLMVPFHLREGPGRGRGMPIDLSGDGHAAMLRAGAVLGKLELGAAAIVPWHFFAAPGLEILFGLGGTDIFVNAHGERFLAGTDIRRDMRGRSSVGLAIAREMREGRGPVYLDVTDMSAANRRLIERVIPIVMRNFEAAGFDIGRDRIPYSVIVMSTHSVGGGGAAIDDRMATSLPRLYAGGNCTDGAYMSMQQNLTDCAAMGYWAGQNAGREALQNDPLALREEQVQRYATVLTEPLRRTAGLDYPALRDRVRELYATRMGMTIDAEKGGRIHAFLEELLEEDLPAAFASDARSLCRIHGIRNFCETLRAVVAAVLHRTESRGNVLRSDYPLVDNEHWLKYTRVRRNADGVLEVWDEPVSGAVSGAGNASRHPFFAEAQA